MEQCTEKTLLYKNHKKKENMSSKSNMKASELQLHFDTTPRNAVYCGFGLVPSNAICLALISRAQKHLSGAAPAPRTT